LCNPSDYVAGIRYLNDWKSYKDQDLVCIDIRCCSLQ
jgi:hypothetical protein